jgi:hypothetical protein
MTDDKPNVRQFFEEIGYHFDASEIDDAVKWLCAEVYLLRQSQKHQPSKGAHSVQQDMINGEA